MESSFLSPVKAIQAVHIQPGAQVADFGSGSGFFARAAARAAAPGKVWIVDVHKDLLLRTKTLAVAEGLQNVELAHGNCEVRGGSHLPDESMDIVIAANMLFCADDKQALVEEIWRVLKPRGRALIVDWKDSYGGIGPHPSHVIEEAAAKKLFLDGGFELMNPVPVGAYHWGFLMRKK